MTETTTHLTASAAALLSEPNAGRIRAIGSRRWILYPRAKQALAIESGNDCITDGAVAAWVPAFDTEAAFA